MKTTGEGLANGKITERGAVQMPDCQMAGRVERVAPNTLRAIASQAASTGRAPPMRPIVLRGAQSLYDRVPADVMPFGQCVRAIADAMVEVIILPIHPLEARRRALPLAEHFRHAWISRKLQERVQMIRHQQQQLTPPRRRRMILLRRTEKGRSNPGREERHLAGGDPDADME